MAGEQQTPPAAGTSVEQAIDQIANSGDICAQYPPGALNPSIQKQSPFAATHDPQRHSNMAALSDVMRSSNSGDAPSAVQGPFLAIVVAIKSKKTDDKKEPLQLASRLVSMLDPPDTKPPKLVEIKAYIPELNYWGCPPGDLDNPSPEAINIIESLPTYTAKNESIPEPAIYDLVWVNFQRMGDFTTGIYIEPTGDYLPKAAGVNAAGAFGTCGAGTPGTSGAPGSSLPNTGPGGLNYPLTHAGLELPPRRDPIDPNSVRGVKPIGKGMWMFHGGNVETKAAQCAAAGINYILVSSIIQKEGATPSKISPVEKLKKYAEVFLAKGIYVYHWGWPMPGKEEEFVNTMVTLALQAGASGIVADPEAAYEKMSPQDGYAAALTCGQLFIAEAQKNGLVTGFTSYGAVYDPPYLLQQNPNKRVTWYSGFKGVDMCFPQLYGGKGHVAQANPRTRADYWTKNVQAYGDIFGAETVMPILGAYGRSYNDYPGGGGGTYVAGTPTAGSETTSKPPQRMKEEFNMCPIPNNSVSWWSYHNLKKRPERWDVVRNAGNSEGDALAMSGVAAEQQCEDGSTALMGQCPPASGTAQPAPNVTNPTPPPPGGGTSIAKQADLLSQIKAAEAKVEELSVLYDAIEREDLKAKIAELYKDLHALQAAGSQPGDPKGSPSVSIFNEIKVIKNKLDDLNLQLQATQLKQEQAKESLAMASNPSLNDTQTAALQPYVEELTKIIELRTQQSTELAAQISTESVNLETKITEAGLSEEFKAALFKYDEARATYASKAAAFDPAENAQYVTPQEHPDIAPFWALAEEAKQVYMQIIDTEIESLENKIDPDQLPQAPEGGSSNASSANADATTPGDAASPTPPVPALPSPSSPVACGVMGGPGALPGAAGGGATTPWTGATGGTAFQASRAGFGGKIVNTSHICDGHRWSKSSRTFSKASKRRKVTMFVIHETASGIRKTCPGYNSIVNQNRKPSSYCNVMFWLARNGDVLQTQPPEIKAPHANWSNACSIGCEMVVPCFGYVDGNYSQAAQKQAAIGVVVIGPHADPVKGLKTSKKAAAWHGHFCMPAEIQMRRMWELIQSYISNPTDVVQIPAKFPAINESEGFYKSGPYPNSAQATGTNGYWWSGENSKGTPSCTKPNHQGVVAHARWPRHSDGCAAEYYCFARTKGFSSHDAYKMAALMMAVCGGNVINGIRSPGGYRTCPLPGPEMSAAAKSWWGNRPLNACADSVAITGAPVTDGIPPAPEETAAVGDGPPCDGCDPCAQSCPESCGKCLSSSDGDGTPSPPPADPPQESGGGSSDEGFLPELAAFPEYE